MTVFDLAFLASAGLIVYTYALYPVAIWLMGLRRPIEWAPLLPDEACPSVTAIIAVHNEAHRVQARIDNLRAMDYPQDRLQLIFVSDGSTDQTVSVLENVNGIKVMAYPERQGKAHAINTAMATVTTPVVLLCDVRQQCEPTALRTLVSTLMQDGVGAVSGELVHRDPQTHVAANIGLYWRYEKWIRRAESRFNSVVGATGALYVIRKDGFVPLDKGTLLDDFEIPMQIVKQGRRVLFDGRALVYDELQSDMAGERKRKLRTLGGNFQSFARHPWLFSWRQNPIWLEFISHKVLRLVVPYAMLAALTSSLLSSTGLTRGLGMLQVAFYLAALAGMGSPACRHNKLVAFAAVFVELNWTAMQAGLQFARGRLDTRWEKT